MAKNIWVCIFLLLNLLFVCTFYNSNEIGRLWGVAVKVTPGRCDMKSKHQLQNKRVMLMLNIARCAGGEGEGERQQ